jgi:hypothetical protein
MRSSPRNDALAALGSQLLTQFGCFIARASDRADPIERALGAEIRLLYIQGLTTKHGGILPLSIGKGAASIGIRFRGGDLYDELTASVIRTKSW